MRLVVVGASGRMGRMLVQAVAASEGCTLAGAIEREGAPALGEDAGVLAGLPPLGVPVTDDPLTAFAAADGVLDFTAPAATVFYAELAAQARIVHVVGTTGLSPDDLRKLDAAARHARIVRSGNMSLGVNLLAGLVRKVAATLGEEFDIEILEMHHRHKVDAPSGTALLLGEAAADGRAVALAERKVAVRDGQTGPREPGTIGFATLRGGSVIGEHSVIFAGAGERLELTHRAEDRGLFARGAIRAALWAQPREPGLYGMDDVLGL
ncbi:4-hydroxy-tetrahydrodipicolinate reductase [Methylobacterium oryzihabitans]|uniref:4-hydroxy-tetrahydrodipicolinate reductase n=1 Tax=Methylobacterium oryzihabitans TaxID=2499852 RepID=A0A3S2VB23_9HYPH|nr:4-hydroxy-tetrahydrodipicolinate reductase [Methylobacterium oryzihabitans]RVU18803.1 4-hydroxy-tetrahydrodipicolinate reductase [Methylobacterium oryzihabitans]